MTTKDLDDLVKEIKDEREEEKIYYIVPEEKPDARKDKMEAVHENGGKDKATIRETDAERMIRAEQAIPRARDEVYRDRETHQENFKKKLISARKAAQEMKKEDIDMGDIGMVNNSASKNIALLAALEPGKDHPDPFSYDRIIEARFTDYKQLRDAYQKMMVRHAKGGKKGSFIKEGFNIGANLLFNMIPFRGTYLNAKTKKHLNENKDKKHKLAFLKPGKYQGSGAMARLGEGLRSKGYLPIVLSGKHGKYRSNEENAKETMKDIQDFYQQVSMSPKDFKDIIYVGHSRGAHIGRSMSVDETIQELGIKRVYQIAPNTISPFDEKRPGKIRKALGHLRTNDGSGIETMKELLDYEKTPLIDNYVISGKHDLLAGPGHAIDPHAKRHYLLEDGSATHVGTAGSNPKVNADIIDLIRYHEQDKAALKIHGKTPTGYHRQRDR